MPEASPHPTRTVRPSTAALVLTLAAAAVPLGLVGCSTAGPRVMPAASDAAEPVDGSLVLQLAAADFTPADAAPLPRSFQRRWAGTGLTPTGQAVTSAAPQAFEVRLAPPRRMDRQLRRELAGRPPREATLDFTAEQPADPVDGRAPITVLKRPAVTLTLVTPPTAPTEGQLRSGLARVTFDADFLAAAAEFDPRARPADALWLAMHGLDTRDLRRLHAARARLSLPDAVRLADAGVDPAGLRQMERRGTVFRVEEWLDLADAGLQPAAALAFVDAGVAPTVADLTAAHAAQQQAVLAAALEAQAAEQARIEAETAARLVAEAEAEAERLEREALALEAQQLAQAQAVQTAEPSPELSTADQPDPSAEVAEPLEVAAAPSPPEAIAPSEAPAPPPKIQPLAIAESDEPSAATPPAPTPSYYAQLMTDADAPEAPPAVQPLDPAPPSAASPPPSYYAQLMADADAPDTSPADRPLDPAPPAETADPPRAASTPPASLDELPVAAEPLVAAPPTALEPLAPAVPVAAGDMIPTEPAERAVPARYVELLGKLHITRPAHVAALYQARVPPKLIHRFQRAGVRPSVIELIDAHRLQLDPASAQTLTDAGYDVTIYDLALLDEAGVDPSYAAALFDERFRPLTATQLVELWENRVSVADIREARAKALATPMSDREH